MNTNSLWLDSTPRPSFEPLAGNLEVEVAIVGGGITGLTTGLLLARSGKRVALIEAERIGSGETGHTTAHLTTTLDLSYSDIISKFGKGDAHLVHDSRRFALDALGQLAREYRANCDWREVDQYLFAETEEQYSGLQEEAQAAASVGVEAELVSHVPLPFATLGAVRFRRQAQFLPLAYLRTIAEAFVQAGGKIFEHTRVSDIVDGAPCTLKTLAGTIRAEQIVVATHSPINNRFLLQTKLGSYRSYAIAAPMPDAPNGLFLEHADPYHYIRHQEVNGVTYLVVGGEDHKVGYEADTEKCFAALEAYTLAHFPSAHAVTHRWSGQIIQPVDGLPYIGTNPGSDHVYVATGFSGDGITSGTLSAFLITDLIGGHDNRFAALYAPSRVNLLASAKEFVKENAGTPVALVGDRLKRSDAQSLDAVPRGEGKIVRSHGERVAAYRDESDGLHLFSPVCPHMGCYVRWNNSEKSWDCPCHGSRFGCVSGEVLNGPAIAPLSKTKQGDTPPKPEPKHA